MVCSPENLQLITIVGHKSRLPNWLEVLPYAVLKQLFLSREDDIEVLKDVGLQEFLSYTSR